jgi:gliding motility-associated-like protein
LASATEGCPDTITKLVEVLSSPGSDFTTDATCGKKTLHDTIYFDGPVQLEVKQGYDHYLWNTGDSSNSILVTNEGWYKVTIENAVICSTTDSVLMLYCDLSLRMPNAFTPNNDGLNDLFRPVTQFEKITSFRMDIFDRWGRNIFETQNIIQGWNGTIEGKPAPAGVYMYTISFKNPSGVTKILKGTFTLVR